MNTTHKIVTMALAVGITLGLPHMVFANTLRDAREDFREAQKEVRETKKNVFEEMKEKIDSKTEALKRTVKGLGVTLANAKITAKTETSLTVEKDGKSYTVLLDDKTQLRRRFWGKSELSEFSVGNIVNVIGRYTDDTKTTINAQVLRNISIQKRFGVFFGEVKSLLSSGWVMSTKSENRADQTVTISSETKLENRKGEAINQVDIKVGDKVRVHGLWDRSANTVTEVKEVKDFNLPIVPTVTATVTVAVTPTP